MSRINKKWGGFSHGNPNKYYYNINSEINIDNNNFSIFKEISSFFNVNYINEISFYNEFINQDEHSYANKLLNVSNEHWKEYSYMYNTNNIEDYVNLGDAKGDIVIKFNLSNVNQNNFNSFIYNLQHIIHEYEPGEYEYDGFTIIINKKNNIVSDKIKISNPIINSLHNFITY